MKTSHSALTTVFLAIVSGSTIFGQLDTQNTWSVAKTENRLPENSPSTGQGSLYKETTLITTVDHRSVKLDWSISGVSAAAVFTLERSRDGILWEALTETDAIHNSDPVVNYTKLDETPYSGTSYYRLSAISENGQLTLLDIASAHIATNEIQLYPNPAIRNCNLVFTHASTPVPIHFLITDIQGRIFQTYSVTAVVGTNTVELDTETLPSGQYLVIPEENAPFTEPIRLTLFD